MNINTEQLLRTSCNQEQRYEPAQENSSKAAFHQFMRPAKDKEEEKKKDSGHQPASHLLSPHHSFAKESEKSAVCATSNAAQLPPEIEALFEKMATCMLVMHSKGHTKTVLCLDQARFASSSLFGTKITIQEFSTAPKVFNVEIATNPLAAAMVDAAKNDLLSAFQYGKLPFSIHRLETEIDQETTALIKPIEDNSEEDMT